MYLLIYLSIDMVHLLMYHLFFFLPSFPFYVFIHTSNIHTYLKIHYEFIPLLLPEPYKKKKNNRNPSLKVRDVSLIFPSSQPSPVRDANADLLAVQHAAHRHLPRCRGDGCDLVSQTGGGFVSIGFFFGRDGETKTHEKLEKKWKKWHSVGRVISSFGGYVILMISNSFGGVIFFLEGHDYR